MMNLNARINLLNMTSENNAGYGDVFTNETVGLLLETISNTFSNVKSSFSWYKTVDQFKLDTVMESSFNNYVKTVDNLSDKSVFMNRASLINFDATNLHCRPGFQINMQDSNYCSYYINAVAKIVDESKASLTNYCNEGIKPFLSGEFSWDASIAIMIAYLRDSSKIRSRLTNYLQEGVSPNSRQFAVKEMPTPLTAVAGDVSYTIHDRNFNYIHRPNESPGPIKLIHIGLK